MWWPVPATARTEKPWSVYGAKIVGWAKAHFARPAHQFTPNAKMVSTLSLCPPDFGFHKLSFFALDFAVDAFSPSSRIRGRKREF
jgi:hypothetical protein